MARVAKTKAYVFDVNPSYASTVKMEVERKRQEHLTPAYYGGYIQLNQLKPGFTIDDVIELVTKSTRALIETTISQHKKRFKTEEYTLGIKNGQMYISSFSLEPMPEYEKRVGRVIKGRLSAEKRKKSLAEAQVKKDKETIEGLLKKYKVDAPDGLLAKVKLDEGKV